MKLAEVLLRDTRANQPDADAVSPGALFCVTDEGDILEQSDGAAWNAYSPQPGDFADLGDIPDTLAAIAAVSPIANQGVRFTDGSTAEAIDITDAAVDLLDDADAAAMRATLGLGTAAVANTGDFDAAGAASAAQAAAEAYADAGDAATLSSAHSYTDAAVAAGMVASLDDIGDVDAPTPSDGDVLTYDSGTGRWVAAAAGMVGITSTLDTPPVSPDVADDEFDLGSAIDTAGTRRTGATAWTARDVSGLTNAVSGGELIYTLPQTSATIYQGYSQPFPGAGDCTYRVKVVPRGRSANFHRIGLTLERGAGGSRNTLSFYVVTNSGQVAVDQISTGSDTFNSNLITWTGVHAFSPTWLEVAISGTDLSFRWIQPDMDRWTEPAVTAQAAWLGGRPDRIAVVMLSGNATAGDNKAYVPWFRRVA